MYWFRDGSALSLLPWLLVMAGVWLGGWLLAGHAFRLGSRERLIAGLALGVVLYSWLVNVVGQLAAPLAAFVAPALLLLTLGCLLAWKQKKKRWLDPEDLKVWPWLLAGLALFWVFALMGKGLALFDEQKNLSLISIIANGDIAPRFFLDYPLKYIYHYGFHLFGASLMRLGGMLPWSAFDVAKALLWSLSLLLAALLGQRYLGKRRAWLPPFVLAFASGTRYLLFLLPPGILLRANELITLQGTSAFINKPFSEALASGWTIDGGPPMDYIFGFLNGIMDPLVMAHQGPNILSVLIFLLVWLLATRLRHRGSFLLLAPVLAMWALAWEATYALFMLGLFLFAVLAWWRWRSLDLPYLRPVLYAALLSIPIVLIQGGTVTELARDAIFGIEGPGLLNPAGPQTSGAPGLLLALAPAPALQEGLFGFSLRWPPAILSAHLGALSLFSPVELLVGLLELGPIILFVPWITRWAWRRGRAGDWPLAVFLVAAWIGLLMPIFLQYQSDRDISRLTWQALLTWTLMLTLMLFDGAFRWPNWIQKAAWAGLALMVFGGLVVGGIQLSAASTTQLAHTYTELDAQMVSQVWGRFALDDKIYGPLGNTTVITGQLTGQLLGEPPPRDDRYDIWENPTLDVLLENGYQFAFIDSRRWDDYSAELRESFDAPCVELFAEVWDNSRVNFRRMLDLRPCYAAEP